MGLFPLLSNSSSWSFANQLPIRGEINGSLLHFIYYTSFDILDYILYTIYSSPGTEVVTNDTEAALPPRYLTPNTNACLLKEQVQTPTREMKLKRESSCCL